MNKNKQKLVVGITCLSLLFTTSCQQLGPVGSAIAGGGVGALEEILSGNGNINTERLIKKVAVGAAAGLALYYIAKANAQQQQIAANNGRSAASSRAVRQKISSGQARKAAIVVPPKNGNPGGIMKVNPETGRPESDKIYQPKGGGSLSTGDVVKLDGTPCALYGSYSQGM